MVNKYVIFYCDDCDLLKPAIDSFVEVHTRITVHTSSSIDDLVHKVNTKMPELILVYLHDPNKNYMDLVKTIRDNTSTSLIPVLIYKTLPGAAELKTVFKNLSAE